MTNTISTLNTKQIKISYHTVGAFGILNFDSADQSYAYTSATNSKSHDAVNTAGKNLRFGKAIFTSEDGNLVRTNVISDAAIKQAVFNADCPYASSEIWYKPVSAIIAYITSPVMLMKGYLGCIEGNSIRRKSMLTFSCAKMCGSTVPVMQVNSTKEQGVKSSTSFFTSETCGDTEWRGSVLFNVGNGENFIDFSQSAPQSDPSSINEKAYEAAVQDSVGDKGIVIKDYTRTGAVGCPSERGVILPGKVIASLVNMLTDRIRGMSREGRGASLGQVVIDGISVRGQVEGYESDINGWTDVPADSVFGCVEPRPVYRESTSEEVNAVNIAKAAQKAAEKKKTKPAKKSKPGANDSKGDSEKSQDPA